MTSRERTLILAAVVAGVLGGAAWGAARLVAARDDAEVAATALADCERLARRIETARGPAADADPAIEAGGDDRKAPEIVRRIEAAAVAAELPGDAVDRIEPGQPRRLGTGPFLEHSTTVHLRGVDLRQLFTFLHAVTTGGGGGGGGGGGADRRGVGLKFVRLTTPAGESGGERWSVEGTLTHTTYAPKAATPAPR